MKKILIQILISLPFITGTALAENQDYKKDGHKPENNAKVKISSEKNWSYGGDAGPDYWSTLSSRNVLCKIGKNQSPIDLKWTAPISGGAIKTSYHANKMRVIDNGHTIQVNLDSGNMVNIRGKRYELLQIHFHSLSEHTIAKKHAPIEAHFVHKNETGNLAVLGVMIQEGTENAALEKIWKNIPKKKKQELRTDIDFATTELLPTKRTYYHYSGSLTTPPCSEGVNWNVFNTPITASKKQIEMFRVLYANNNRPIQKLNERKVTNY